MGSPDDKVAEPELPAALNKDECADNIPGECPPSQSMADSTNSNFNANLTRAIEVLGAKNPLNIVRRMSVSVDKIEQDKIKQVIKNNDASDEKIDKKLTPFGNFLEKRSQVLAAISASLGSMIIGFVSAYSSPALASMQKPESRLHVTTQEQSWIGSLMPLSAICGGILGGTLIEKMGRRTTLVGTGVPFIIAWMLIAFAQDVMMIYAGRTICGLGVGIASMTIPVFMGEAIQPEIRGTLGLLTTTIGNIGVLVCFTVGSYVDWSWLAIIGGIIPIPFIGGMMLLPETPRWYVSKGRPKEALKALKWLRPKHADIMTELAEIEASNAEMSNQNGGVRELITPANFKILMISIGLMLFQQFSGINAVIFYTVSIFKSAGSSIDEHLSTIIVGLVNLGATFLANALIDRLGRKKLLYISDTFMILSLITLGAYFYVKDIYGPEYVAKIEWLPLLSFIVYVVAFSLGFGPIPWLMMGEIFPNKIRGAAASISTAFNWTCTFVVTKTFNDITDTFGTHGAFWLFAAICSTGFVFVIFFVPETKGKSLEQIEVELLGAYGGESTFSCCKRQQKSDAVKETIDV